MTNCGKITYFICELQELGVFSMLPRQRQLRYGKPSVLRLAGRKFFFMIARHAARPACMPYASPSQGSGHKARPAEMPASRPVHAHTARPPYSTARAPRVHGGCPLQQPRTGNTLESSHSRTRACLGISGRLLMACGHDRLKPAASGDYGTGCELSFFSSMGSLYRVWSFFSSARSSSVTCS